MGTTASGRKIWRWTGPVVTEAAPVEIIFTNRDMLTSVMPFSNGSYYNYDHLIYKAGLTESTGIQFTKATYATAGYYVDLQDINTDGIKLMPQR
ncbi:MAG: hypothetical protein K6A78_02180 [Prevotella sp.]|nr:hypothetical protein [Prevotella sp.]